MARKKKKKEEKKTKKKRKSYKMPKGKMSRAELDEALLDNFIGLQKVMTKLAGRFEDMSGNISRMLSLFELSAKSFAEKGGDKQSGVDEDFLKKLDSLLDQNKTIAKGIMLMEDKIRSRSPVNRSPMQIRPTTFPSTMNHGPHVSRPQNPTPLSQTSDEHVQSTGATAGMQASISDKH